MTAHSSMVWLACAGALAAQVPTFVPLPTALARMELGQMPEILRQWRTSTAGRLLAEDDLAPVVQAALDGLRRQHRRHRLLIDTAYGSELQMSPWIYANLLRDLDLGVLFEQPEAVRDVAIGVAAGDITDNDMSFAMVVRCLPRVEGKWTKSFEQHLQTLRRSPWLHEQPGGKIDGYDVFRFTADEPEHEQGFRIEIPTLWHMHLPGTFVNGAGDPAQVGLVAPAPDRPAQLYAGYNVRAFHEMVTKAGGMVPGIYTSIGLEHILEFAGAWRFVGDLVEEDVVLELFDEADGLLAALLSGTAPLPAQPLPDGALAQLRCVVQPAQLAAWLLALDDAGLPKDLLEQVAKAWNGGVALGVLAPPPGGLIPRIHLTLGIADADALDKLLRSQFGENAPIKQVTYEGVECTMLSLPDLPNGIQPCWCRIDSVLHVAESGRSMRTFLQRLQQGGEAMDVGDAEAPPGDGDVFANLDVRLDELELYRAFRDVWLPLAVTAMPGEYTPLVKRDDMPDVDLAAEYLRKSRGVVHRAGKRYVLRHRGTFGGLIGTTLAMAWPPLLSADLSDYTADAVQMALTKAKAEQLWQALSAFQSTQGRWPKDLTELLATQQLQPEVLEVIGAERTEPVVLTDGRTVQSAFHLFAEPVETEHGRILLVEVQTRSYERVMLTESGAMPDVWGELNEQPIEQFGK